MLIRFARFAFAVALTLVTGVAIAAEFSADRICTSSEAGDSTGRVFISGSLARIELALPQDSGYQKSIWIYRGDKKKLWHLFPESLTYTEYDASDPARVRFLLLQNLDEERGFRAHRAVRSYQGTDVVAGLDCNVFRYANRGIGELATTSIIYYSTALRCPVRWIGTMDNATETCEYRNILVEKQPRYLFELPFGYTTYRP